MILPIKIFFYRNSSHCLRRF